MPYLPTRRPPGCKDCALGKQENIRVVASVLPSHAKVLFVGEAPGRDENIQGIPFVGEAGKLLNQVLSEVGISRNDIAITNVVACNPPGNATPSKKSVNACSKYLFQEIADLKPDLIVPLGATALRAIFPELGTLTKARGNFYDMPTLGCKVLPTFHPAYILRNMLERSTFVMDLSKVSKFMRGEVTQAPKTPTSYFVIRTKAQMDWLVNNLHTNSEWACDTETTSTNPLEAKIFIITFSWQENVAALLDVRLFAEEEDYFFSKVKEVMENNSSKIFHNGGYDIQCFLNHGIHVQNYHVDTMLMHYLLGATEKDLGLDKLAHLFTDVGGYDLILDRYKQENHIDNYMDIPPDVIHPYALIDADVTFRSYKKLLPQIHKEGLSFVLRKIMIPTQIILAMTEYTGVSIDVPYLEKTIVNYTIRMEEQFRVVKDVPQVRQYETDLIYREKKALMDHWAKSKTLSKKYPVFEDYMQERLRKKPEMFDIEFNVNSSKQLKELLIDRMRLKVIKTTDTGAPSTDKEVLEEYALTNDFCYALLEYRRLSHLKSTFLEGIKTRLTNDKRIHTDYYLWSTETGRPSSRDPNLNNIPRTGTADDIKDIFCTDKPVYPGDKYWLMEADAGQAEFRIWINYSRDPQALSDLNSGYDIHKLMAAAGKGKVLPKGDIPYTVYQELIADVTKAERQAAKNVVFGLMYGRGAASVAKQLGISKAQAEEIINQFFTRYPLAYRWIQQTIARTRTDLYVRNLYGRKRLLPNIVSNDSDTRSAAERQAINAPIQSGASDTVFLAAIRIFKHIWNRQLKTRLVLTVYDSLVFNIPDNELKEMVDLVSVEMTRKPSDVMEVPAGAEIIVPFTSDMKVGTHWGSLMEIDPKEDWNIVYNKLMKHREETEAKFAI